MFRDSAQWKCTVKIKKQYQMELSNAKTAKPDQITSLSFLSFYGSNKRSLKSCIHKNLIIGAISTKNHSF